MNTGFITLGMKHLSVCMWPNIPATPHKLQAFSPNFLVKKFSVNREFLQIFGQVARISGESARIWKISSLGN